MNQRSTTMMIFVPLARHRALAARESGRIDDDLDGYAATGQLIMAHDYRPDEREDADYAAQLYASLAGLAEGGDGTGRLVVAADVPIARVSDGSSDLDYGSIRVRGLDWADVTAVFVDEPDAVPSVDAARKAVRAAGDEVGLEAIMALPDVEALTEQFELLWHTPDEDW